MNDIFIINTRKIKYDFIEGNFQHQSFIGIFLDMIVLRVLIKTRLFVGNSQLLTFLVPVGST